MAKAEKSEQAEMPLDGKKAETGLTTQAPPPPPPAALSGKSNSAKELFAKPEIQAKFQEMLGKRATSFMTSVLQIVASNKLLATADPVSVYQCAAVAATLDLPLNNSLGFCWIVPYNQSYQDKDGQWKKKQVATFQIGWKGFVQLLQRTGQCKTVGACPIKEGQIKSANPLTGYEFDFDAAISEKKVGYAAMFTLLNGFSATLYMTTEEVQAHAKRFSKTYASKGSVWETDFDSMACKTVLKLLLSKYAPLSIDIQKAIQFDQAVVKDAETGEVDYVDHEEMNDQEMWEDLQAKFEYNIEKIPKDQFDNIKRVLENKEVASYSKVAKILNEL